MSGADPSDERPTAARLSELESLFMHLQRTVGDLDEMLLAQARRIDDIQRSADRLDQQLESLEESASQPPAAEDEKPPHY